MMKKEDNSIKSLVLALPVLVAGLSIIVSILFAVVGSPELSTWALVKWATAQWVLLPRSTSLQWQQQAWDHWEELYWAKLQAQNLVGDRTRLPIPTVKVQDFDTPEALLDHLESQFGPTWRQKPVLFQGLWSQEELQQSSSSPRRLSTAGLLTENLTIPYFRDARVYGALSPNDRAPVRDIVANITFRGEPHKIGTQFLVQTYPELIREVAPTEIVTTLFGDRFQPHHVEAGALGMPFLPSLTTVPIFVAGVAASSSNTETMDTAANTNTTRQKQPFTALHCEPIGNIAVQLEGEKQWTLVSPEYSFLLKPSVSPDGRAFFVSSVASEDDMKRVPRYHATTGAGDALWVPTWTWHRVDYTTSIQSSGDKEDSGATATHHNQVVAVGGSLFHLRPKELILNNPLFAFLVVPSLIKEVLQINTQ